MASAAGDITFVVPGQPEAAPLRALGDARRGQGLGARRHAARRRRAGAGHGAAGRGRRRAEHRQRPDAGAASGDARDLMQAQSGAATRSALAAPARRDRGAAAPGEVEVPAQLGWPGLEAQGTRGAPRGWMGQALLSALPGAHRRCSTTRPPSWSSRRSPRRSTARSTPASTSCRPMRSTPLKGSGRKLDAVPAASDGGPMLVLVHGTFVDTVSTFGKLWTLHPRRCASCSRSYGDRVYALDHPTLGESPIANALTLVRAMPPGARLHLVTHSRGGLVAEVLVRACGGGAARQCGARAVRRRGLREHRADLRALVKDGAGQGPARSSASCAWPARRAARCSRRSGSTPTSRSSSGASSWPACRSRPQLVDFLHEVARRRADPAELPGLEAMMPESPVIAWLNSAQRTDPRRAARRRRRHGGRLDRLVGQDAAVRRVLLDRQRPRRADPLDVRRRGARRDRAAAAARASCSTGRQGLALQLLQQRAHGRARSRARCIDDTPADFAAIGPLSWAGEDASGTRAALAVARSRGPAQAAADRPAVFVLPGHPRLQPEARRQAHLARLSLRQRPEEARLGSGDRGAHRARRADRQPLRRPDRAPRRHPRGDPVRLRLAPPDRRRGAPPGRGGRCRARRARAPASSRCASLAHSMGGLVARTMRSRSPTPGSG